MDNTLHEFLTERVKSPPYGWNRAKQISGKLGGRGFPVAVGHVREPSGCGRLSSCNPAYIGMEAANCWSTLGRFDLAAKTFEESLRGWPQDLRRDYGLCLARFSSANAGREDLEGMCAAGRQAVEVVSSAPSSRSLAELQRLRVRLASWRRNAEVSDLGDRIRSLLAPAA